MEIVPDTSIVPVLVDSIPTFVALSVAFVAAGCLIVISYFPGFMNEYQNAVEKFKTLQPDAVIYVQAIMHVTQKKSDSDPIFNNPGIDARNQRIQQLADGVRVFYIDVNEVVCDDQGGLKQELTFDNLHLYGSKYNIWVDFLKTKGIGTE